MRKTIAGALALALLTTGAPAFAAKEKGSSGRQAQAKGTREIPICTRKLGTIAIVEPDNQWWREFNLGSPEAILKVFVQKSAALRWSTAAARWAAAQWNAQWPITANCRPGRTSARAR